MINNPKTARIIAAIVIAMMVLTLAAALFGCSATNTSSSSSDTTTTGTKTSQIRISAGKDPDSGLTLVAHLRQEAQQTLVSQGRAVPPGPRPTHV